MFVMDVGLDCLLYRHRSHSPDSPALHMNPFLDVDMESRTHPNRPLFPSSRQPLHPCVIHAPLACILAASQNCMCSLPSLVFKQPITANKQLHSNTSTRCQDTCMHASSLHITEVVRTAERDPYRASTSHIDTIADTRGNVAHGLRRGAVITPVSWFSHHIRRRGWMEPPRPMSLSRSEPLAMHAGMKS